MKKGIIIIILLIAFTCQTNAQDARLTRNELMPVQNELYHKLMQLCRFITKVGNTPPSRANKDLLRAACQKQEIIENDIPPLFLDFANRKMKTSWYDKTSGSYKYRNSRMPTYLASLKTQSLNGIKYRSYKIGIVEGYINGKLADPKNWKKKGNLSDGSEIYESTVSLMQEYQSVEFAGSVEQKNTIKEKDRKDYKVYMIKQPKDMGNKAMILLGDVYRIVPL